MLLRIGAACLEHLERKLLGLAGIGVGLIEVIVLQIGAAYPRVGLEIFRGDAALSAIGRKLGLGLGEGAEGERASDIVDDVCVGDG